MAKDRQKRMAHMLGCLVASMTTCAILLHWRQPKPERPLARPTIELIASSIKQPWQSIRIEPGRLDGQIDPERTHFFVDREGRCSWTPSWQTQSQLGQKGVVRIALQPSANTNKLTAAQWETTQRLMTVLREKCAIPNDRNHIVLDDRLAIPAIAARKASAPRASVGQVDLIRSR
jgi:hypothetical protein